MKRILVTEVSQARTASGTAASRAQMKLPAISVSPAVGSAHGEVSLSNRQALSTPPGALPAQASVFAAPPWWREELPFLPPAALQDCRCEQPGLGHRPVPEPGTMAGAGSMGLAPMGFWSPGWDHSHPDGTDSERGKWKKASECWAVPEPEFTTRYKCHI